MLLLGGCGYEDLDFEPFCRAVHRQPERCCGRLSRTVAERSSALFHAPGAYHRSPRGDRESQPGTCGGPVRLRTMPSKPARAHGIIQDMKIAQVAPLYESCPPRLYGGTERVVSYLTEELVRLGHEVTLFASGDSRTAAILEPGCEYALRLDEQVKDRLVYHLTMLDRV